MGHISPNIAPATKSGKARLPNIVGAMASDKPTQQLLDRAVTGLNFYLDERILD